MSVLGAAGISAAGSLIGAGIGSYMSARNLRKSYKYQLRYGERLAQTQRNQFDILYPGANVHDLLGGSPQTPGAPLGASPMSGPDLGGNMASLAAAQLAADTQVETAQISANATQNAAATSSDATIGSASISANAMLDTSKIAERSRADVAKLTNAATLEAATIGITPQMAEIQLKKLADFYGLQGQKFLAEVENTIARTAGQQFQNITESMRSMESSFGTAETRSQVLNLLLQAGALYLGGKGVGKIYKAFKSNPGILKEVWRAARRLNLPVIGQKARYERGLKKTAEKVKVNRKKTDDFMDAQRRDKIERQKPATRATAKPAKPGFAHKFARAGKFGRGIPYVSTALIAYELIFNGFRVATEPPPNASDLTRKKRPGE